MQRISLRRYAVAAALALAFAVPAPAHAQTSDLDIALGLAKLLQAARVVISSNQARINDPDVGNKGLTGDVVVAATIEGFVKGGGPDPRSLDKTQRFGRLMNALVQSIGDVVTDGQSLINRQGLGFKGFIPAAFARLVGERFSELVGAEGDIRVTAPIELVRNRKARPDEFEAQVIKEQFLSPQWKRGEIVATEAPRRDRKAFRVMVPEYYTAGCLTCHGTPKGEQDVTGYPKEGGKLDDLGAVISISLFR